MNKDELIALLKENLRVELREQYALYSNDEPELVVSIFFGDELISRDTV